MRQTGRVRVAVGTRVLAPMLAGAFLLTGVVGAPGLAQADETAPTTVFPPPSIQCVNHSPEPFPLVLVSSGTSEDVGESISALGERLKGEGQGGGDEYGRELLAKAIRFWVGEGGEAPEGWKDLSKNTTAWGSASAPNGNRSTSDDLPSLREQLAVNLPAGAAQGGWIALARPDEKSADYLEDVKSELEEMKFKVLKLDWSSDDWLQDWSKNTNGSDAVEVVTTGTEGEVEVRPARRSDVQSTPLDVSYSSNESATDLCPDRTPPFSILGLNDERIKVDDQNLVVVASGSPASPVEPGRRSGLAVVGGTVASLLAGLVIGGLGLFLVGRRNPTILGVHSSSPGTRQRPPSNGGGQPSVPPISPPPSYPSAGTQHTVPGSNGTISTPAMPSKPSKPGWTSIVANGASIRLDDVGLSRIAPIDLPRGRVWGDLTDQFVTMSGWTEKIGGKGEDAQPVLRVHDSGRGLVAVLDGVGGAGAGVARRLTDGTELSGAYVSSRLTGAVLERWTIDMVNAQRDIGDEDPARLAGIIRAVLADEAAQQPTGGLGLKGSMTRQMPTTMAAVTFSDTPGGVVLDALWAGDSRAYVLSPRGGLQVLTVDDTRDTDAMSLIRNDMPMSNLISADQPFTIHHQQYLVNKPALLVAATDGCFGYVLTPAHFEFLVLQTLLDSPDVVSWASALVEELDRVAGDDVSFSICGLGFTSWQHLQTSFTDRCEYLRTEHWDRFAGIADDRERLEQLRDASWNAYRDEYHALLRWEVTAP